MTDDNPQAISNEQIAYLGLIEGVINRMASVSATCKGFAITLFAGVLAIVFSASGTAQCLVLGLAACALILLACFDTWYLLLEKRYRTLYERVLEGSHSVDFDLRNPKDTRGVEVSVFDAIKSKAIWLFYVVLIAVYIVLIISNCAGLF